MKKALLPYTTLTHQLIATVLRHNPYLLAVQPHGRTQIVKQMRSYPDDSASKAKRQLWSQDVLQVA